MFGVTKLMEVGDNDTIKNYCSCLEIHFHLSEQASWFGLVILTEGTEKRKVSRVINNSPQGSRQRVWPKNRWWNHV